MRIISLCESCIWAYSYAEELPDSDSPPLSKIHDNYLIGSLPCEHGYDCNSCDSPSSNSHFARECDGCFTKYAGNRYEHSLEWQEGVSNA